MPTFKELIAAIRPTLISRPALERIDVALIDLAARIAVARTAFADAALHVVDGEAGAEQGRDVAAAQLATLQLERDALVAAREVAQRRVDEQSAREAAEARAAQWDATNAAARALRDETVKLARSIALTARTQHGVLVARERLAKLIPHRHDEYLPVLDRAQWEAIIRREFHRVGLPFFANEFPWGRHDLRALEDEAADVVRIIERWAKQSTANDDDGGDANG